MGLGFGGTCADGGPADQVLQVLRRNRVQRLGGGRQAHLGQVQQQAAPDVQAILDFEGVVQVRIVDQALPAHGGTRLLEVHAHHQEQGVGDLFRQRLEPLGVLVRRLEVVNGAGANHQEQTVVLAVEDVAYHLAAVADGLQGGVTERHLAFELLGSDQGFVGSNVQVVDR